MKGAKFAKESGVGDKGGELHAIDQAIILALCIDVSFLSFHFSLIQH